MPRILHAVCARVPLVGVAGARVDQITFEDSEARVIRDLTPKVLEWRTRHRRTNGHSGASGPRGDQRARHDGGRQPSAAHTP